MKLSSDLGRETLQDSAFRTTDLFMVQRPITNGNKRKKTLVKKSSTIKLNYSQK